MPEAPGCQRRVPEVCRDSDVEPAQRPNRNRGSVAAFFGVSGGINNGVGIP